MHMELRTQVGSFYNYSSLYRSPPHSHRTRGYLCSFPSPETPPPYLGEKDIPPISGIVTIGNYRNTHILFWAFSGNLPQTAAQKIPPFPRNGNTHAAPSCIRVCVCVGGGGAKIRHGLKLHNIHHVLLIIILILSNRNIILHIRYTKKFQGR